MPQGKNSQQAENWTALAEEVEIIAAGIKTGAIGPEEPHPALYYLNRLKAAIRRAVNPDMIAGEMAALERFWTEQVNWCDPLSKDLEKILILYADMKKSTTFD